VVLWRSVFPALFLATTFLSGSAFDSRGVLPARHGDRSAPSCRNSIGVVTARTGRRVPAAPLHGDNVVVRPATLGDAEMLVRWHLDPDVLRFWDGRTFTHDEMAARLSRPDVDAYIVEADGEAVGYLQAWFGDAADVGGLDMVLLPPARGRSLGPDAARTLAHYLITHAGRTRVTVDPYLWNERAIRGWLKAGFRPVQEREPDHEHRHHWLLMEFDVAEAADARLPPAHAHASEAGYPPPRRRR
jgi:aminoglycoside 6'-N-acetyltransferase